MEHRYETFTVKQDGFEYLAQYVKCEGGNPSHFRMQQFSSSGFHGGQLDVYSHDFSAPYDSSEKSDSVWYKTSRCSERQAWLDSYTKSVTRPSSKSEKRPLKYFDNLRGYYFTDGKKFHFGKEYRLTYQSSDYKTNVDIDYNQNGTPSRVIVTERFDEFEADTSRLDFVSTKSVPFISRFILSRANQSAGFHMPTAGDFKKIVIAANWPFADSLESRAAFTARLASLNEAAKRNDVGAMKELATLYLNGDGNNGFRPDIDTALSWFERAAESNDAVAQNMLGVYYSQGFLRNAADERVSGSNGKSAGMARFWLEKAVANGSLQAQKNLVTMAENEQYDRDKAEQDVARQQARQAQLRQALGVMIQQQQIQAQQEQARRDAAERKRAQEAQLQAQREQTAAYERQEAANRSAADQRAFEARREAAIQAQQGGQQVDTSSQTWSTPGMQSGGSALPSGSGSNSTAAQAEADSRRRQQADQERQRQQQAAYSRVMDYMQAQPNVMTNRWALAVLNRNQFRAQCTVSVDGESWAYGSSTAFHDSQVLILNSGEQREVVWEPLRQGDGSNTRTRRILKYQYSCRAMP